MFKSFVLQSFAATRNQPRGRKAVALETAHLTARVVYVLVLATGTLFGAAPAIADPAAATPRDGLIATCAACHGARGEGSVAVAAPRLAGQDAEYLAHALSMFKAGSRASSIMQPVARTLSDADMQAVAGYFAAQHPPVVAQEQPQADEARAGAQLAQFGDGTGVAACFSCHAAGGRGNGARFPSIAGQPASFTVARLHEFQARAAQGGAKPGTMTAVAAHLSEAQIVDAAAYLSTLPR